MHLYKTFFFSSAKTLHWAPLSLQVYDHRYKAFVDGVETDSVMEIDPNRRIMTFRTGNGSKEIVEVHDFKNASTKKVRLMTSFTDFFFVCFSYVFKQKDKRQHTHLDLFPQPVNISMLFARALFSEITLLHGGMKAFFVPFSTTVYCEILFYKAVYLSLVKEKIEKGKRVLH